jgi:hypothetical protein
VSIYAVNGKEPIAAWIPSRDDAGNGTTTLTDLVGSNNGTLTNFALSGSTSNWVADTGAGGVRALDFDGVNDIVPSNGNLSLSNSVSLSFWVYPRRWNVTQVFAELTTNFNTSAGFLVASEGGLLGGFISNGLGGSGGYNGGDFSPPSLDTWHHVVFLFNRVAGTQLNVSAFVDGNLQSMTQRSFGNFTNSFSVARLFIGARSGGTLATQAKKDDIRIFNTTLTADDVAYLYNAGNGRGRIATTPSRRRRELSGGGL